MRLRFRANTLLSSTSGTSHFAPSASYSMALGSMESAASGSANAGSSAGLAVLNSADNIGDVIGTPRLRIQICASYVAIVR